VRTLWPLGKDRNVADVKLPFAFGAAQIRTPTHDDQPFLAALLVVVGPRSFAGRKLVQACAEHASTQAVADGGAEMAKAVAVIFSIPLVLAEQVEDVHRA